MTREFRGQSRSRPKRSAPSAKSQSNSICRSTCCVFGKARFPQVHPLKRAGGRRYYRPEDIDLLRGIHRAALREGLTIRGVQKILREQGLALRLPQLGRGEIDFMTPLRRGSAEPKRLADIRRSPTISTRSPRFRRNSRTNSPKRGPYPRSPGAAGRGARRTGRGAGSGYRTPRTHARSACHAGTLARGTPQAEGAARRSQGQLQRAGHPPIVRPLRESRSVAQPG